MHDLVVLKKGPSRSNGVGGCQDLLRALPNSSLIEFYMVVLLLVPGTFQDSPVVPGLNLGLPACKVCSLPPLT